MKQSKLQEHWRVTNLILHDWTHQPYFSLHVKYQSYGYTRLIAENIRRASPGGMRSTLTWKTLRQQITMVLMRLWQPHFFPIYTPLNRLHFIFLNPLILYICSVNIWSVDATAMLFHSAIPLTVWRVPCCSEFNTFDVKLSVITVCPPFNFELSMPRNLLKTFCAIDRLRLWKHCYHSVSFPVVV